MHTPGNQMLPPSAPCLGAEQVSPAQGSPEGSWAVPGHLGAVSAPSLGTRGQQHKGSAGSAQEYLISLPAEEIWHKGLTQTLLQAKLIPGFLCVLGFCTCPWQPSPGKLPGWLWLPWWDTSCSIYKAWWVAISKKERKNIHFLNPRETLERSRNKKKIQNPIMPSPSATCTRTKLFCLSNWMTFLF